MFPLHALLFSLRVIVVCPGFVTCYYVPHEQIPVQLHELQIFTWFFASTSLHFLVKHLGTPRAQIVVISKCSYKIILTQPVLMPTPSAISCTLTWRFCNTLLSIAQQFSSQIASHGRPDRGSSWRLLLPWRNSTAQCLTMVYDSTFLLYTTVTRLYICCGRTFSSVKTSVTGRSSYCVTSYFQYIVSGN